MQPGIVGICMVAALLGYQVVGNVGYLAVQSEQAALFPIRVGFSGQAHPLGFFHRLGGSETKSQQGKLGTAGTAMVMNGDVQIAAAIHPIGNLCFQSRQNLGGEGVANGEGFFAALQNLNVSAALVGIHRRPDGAA